MKKWNSEYKEESYDEVMEPLLDFATKVLADKNNKKDIEYEGFELDLLTKSLCYPPDFYSEAKNRKDFVKSGKTNLELLLMLAFQLGIEQGGRIHKASNKQEERDIQHLFDDIYLWMKKQKTTDPMGKIILETLKRDFIKKRK